MATATHHTAQANCQDAPIDLAKPHALTAGLIANLRRSEGREQVFLPIDRETRATVDTACAAWHLGRQPQTLRTWACLENGPLRPVRVHGRLAWRVAELRQILGVAQ